MLSNNLQTMGYGRSLRSKSCPLILRCWRMRASASVLNADRISPARARETGTVYREGSTAAVAKHSRSAWIETKRGGFISTRRLRVDAAAGLRNAAVRSLMKFSLPLFSSFKASRRVDGQFPPRLAFFGAWRRLGWLVLSQRAIALRTSPISRSILRAFRGGLMLVSPARDPAGWDSCRCISCMHGRENVRLVSELGFIAVIAGLAA